MEYICICWADYDMLIDLSLIKAKSQKEASNKYEKFIADRELLDGISELDSHIRIKPRNKINIV